jgi:hypothetical protein
MVTSILSRWCRSCLGSVFASPPVTGVTTAANGFGVCEDRVHANTGPFFAEHFCLTDLMRYVIIEGRTTSGIVPKERRAL